MTKENKYKTPKESVTRKSSQSGQALIETTVILLFLVPFVILLFSTSYLIYSSEISSFKLYRTLICTEELKKTEYQCKKKVLKELQSFLFFHEDLKLKLQTNNALKSIVLNSKYQPIKFLKPLSLKYRKELKVKSSSNLP